MRPPGRSRPLGATQTFSRYLDEFRRQDVIDVRIREAALRAATTNHKTALEPTLATHTQVSRTRDTCLGVVFVGSSRVVGLW